MTAEGDARTLIGYAAKQLLGAGVSGAVFNLEGDIVHLFAAADGYRLPGERSGATGELHESAGAGGAGADRHRAHGIAGLLGKARPQRIGEHRVMAVLLQTIMREHRGASEFNREIARDQRRRRSVAEVALDESEVTAGLQPQ